MFSHSASRLDAAGRYCVGDVMLERYAVPNKQALELHGVSFLGFMSKPLHK